jgi:hypothetical protein
MTTLSPFATTYQAPKKPSKYLRLTEGTHMIHLLSKPEEVVSFFSIFDEETKKKTCYPDLGDGNQPAGTKNNWAFKIWNYETKEIQIWEVSQNSIKDFLKTLASSKLKSDWTQYPIEVSRKGEKLETVYTCIAGDKQPITKEIEKAMANTFVNLQAMATGQDPFDSELVIEPSSKSETVDDTPLPEINIEEIQIDTDSVKMPF